MKDFSTRGVFLFVIEIFYNYVMSELAIVKRPLLLPVEAAHDQLISCEQIVAMTPSNAATISEYGYTSDGNDREDVLALPDTVIDGLVDFYKQTRVKPVDARPGYSCHTFTYFTLGAIATIGRPDQFRFRTLGKQWRVDHLMSGQAYLTRNREGIYNHSMLGIDRPAFNLCVDGNDKPLRIYNNRDIMRAYNAKSLFRYQPVDMSFKS
jgi:hypothetical protein